MIPRSIVPEIAWPAVPGDEGALLLALQQQLEESQWLAPPELERRQLAALGALLGHARRSVPYYRDDPAYGYHPGGAGPSHEAWARLPVLTRAVVQEAGAALWSGEVPADHHPVVEQFTSGSTGRPLFCLGTEVTALLWRAITLRQQLWHGRDLSGKLAAIRADGPTKVPPGGQVLPGWGTSIEAVYDTGPCAVFSVHEDVAGQAEWLVEQDPDYLLSVPSNLVALARELQARGACLPRLREVWTYAEALSADRRAVLRRAWGVPVTDMYSTQEVGYIALQCPSGDAYHVQAESVFVEVLDDGGEACPPGQVGRVVVTPLHNYAMPLVRYAVGDYAEVGEACPCGRGLPTLSRIVGRERNMLVLPTGERLWPTLDWAHVAPNRQLQLVQRELDHIEARMVGPRPLTAAEEAAFAAAMHERFGYRFRVSFRYLERIERGPGLKFEDFVCLVDTDGRDPAT